MRSSPILLVTLAACATASTPGGAPSWREVERALVASLFCDEADGARVCHNQPRRAALTRLRCLPAGDGGYPGRVLCRYAGRMSWMDGRQGPIASECAYLIRDAAGRWVISAYPDSEFCEF
jgi:hypothetical protein